MPAAARSGIPIERLTSIIENPQALAAGTGDEMTLPPEVLQLMREALSTSITTLFVIGLVVLGIALIVNVWLPESTLKSTWEPEAQAGKNAG